jgi:hypothetical protein
MERIVDICIWVIAPTKHFVAGRPAQINMAARRENDRMLCILQKRGMLKFSFDP